MNCNPGFTGSPAAYCGVDGQWQFSGSCVGIDCGPVNHPANADLVDCSTVYGGKCILNCPSGSSGNVGAICLPTGRWDYTGTCNPVTCPPIAHPDLNAQPLEPCLPSPGSVCGLSCVAPTRGNPSASCLHSGQWVYSGSCFNIDCGIPAHPSGKDKVTVIDPCQTSFMETCRLSCAPGYSGSPTASCQDSGSWVYSGDCQTMDCGPPMHPSGPLRVDVVDCSTFYGDSCVMSCKAGFLGMPAAVCSPAGIWSYSGACTEFAGDSLVIACGLPAHPAGAVPASDDACNLFYGHVCRMSCPAGQSGTPAAVCTASGTWQYTGSCSPLSSASSSVSCSSAPVPPPHALDTSHCAGFPSCAFDCEPGFAPTGTLTCVDPARDLWSSRVLCKPMVSCGAPLHPSLNVKYDPGCSTKPSLPCNLVCKSGFVGDPVAVCTSAGNWEYAGQCTRLPGAVNTPPADTQPALPVSLVGGDASDSIPSVIIEGMAAVPGTVFWASARPPTLHLTMSHRMRPSSAASSPRTIVLVGPLDFTEASAGQSSFHDADAQVATYECAHRSSSGANVTDLFYGTQGSLSLALDHVTSPGVWGLCLADPSSIDSQGDLLHAFRVVPSIGSCYHLLIWPSPMAPSDNVSPSIHPVGQRCAAYVSAQRSAEPTPPETGVSLSCVAEDSDSAQLISIRFSGSGPNAGDGFDAAKVPALSPLLCCISCILDCY